MANMYKPQTRCTPQCHDYRMGQSIQTGVPGGKRLIHQISGSKIFRPIHATIPGDPGCLRCFSVHIAYPASFPATQLLHRQLGNIFVREAQLIHFPHNRQMFAGIGNHLCLFQKQSRSGGQGPSMGIIAHTMLSHPNGSHTGIAHQFHRPVRHTGTRSQKQYRNCGSRHQYDSFFIGNGNRTILPAQGTMFQIQKRHPILDLRQRLQFRANDTGHFRHCHHPRRIMVIKPIP